MKTLALTIGDRYGVGPELVARYVDALPAHAGVRLAVIGDRAVFERGRRVTGITSNYPVAGSLESLPDAPWCFLERPFEAEVEPVGRVSPEAGEEVLGHLRFAADAALAGTVHGLVFAPLNKQAMLQAGHSAGDELDYFRSLLPTEGESGEINVLGDIWTSRVTSHVPLKDVAAGITREGVARGIALMHDTLVRSGKASPRIAVAALNPHAGDGGAFGSEEIDILGPAIAEARRQQLRVEGPFPADTVFPRAMSEGHDGVVTMYHDQGQIALKLLGLGRGVTLLAGFPLPIATPGHGTAYDIAGTGKAKVDGLTAAVALAVKLMQSTN